MSTIIVFSKDRPMQLHAYIESLLHYSDCRQEDIHILYKEILPIRYDKVIEAFPRVDWLPETAFSSQVCELVEEAEDTVMFGCDDVLFVDNFSLGEMREFLLSHDEVFGFSVRVGKNIPPFPKRIERCTDRVCTWNWQTETLHYGYPWELDCTLYRKEDVQEILENIDSFANPNYLESIPAQKPERFVHRNRLACYYSTNKAAVITVNRVQDTHPNDIYEKEDADILSLFMQYHYEGRRIDIRKAAELKRNTVHVDGSFLIRTPSVKQRYAAAPDIKSKIRNLIGNLRILGGLNPEELQRNWQQDISLQAYLRSRIMQPDSVALDCYQTVELLQHSPKSFVRYGDGEFTLMLGEGIGFQEYVPELSLSLWEMFLEETEEFYVGVPYVHFDVPSRFLPFVQQFHTDSGKWIREFIYRYLPFNRKQYIDTGFNQVYQTYEDMCFGEYYERVRKLFEKKPITVIAGKNILDKLQYDVFEYAASIDYLYGPTQNAYADYENLKEKALTIPKEHLICMILGPTSKVLVRDLTKMGYMAWDVGHLAKDYDAYCRGSSRDGETIDRFYAPD